MVLRTVKRASVNYWLVGKSHWPFFIKRLQMKYTDIDGWFDYEDIFIEQVENAQDGDIFVEIGAYKGKSTVFMAETIKRSGKKIKFHSYDALYGIIETVGPNPLIRQDLKEEIESNLLKCEVQDYVEMHFDTSINGAKDFDNDSIQFVYIDGCHSYESVSSDNRAWWPKVKWGGYIGGHDYCHIEVTCAVREFIPLQLIQDRPPRSWLAKKMVPYLGHWVKEPTWNDDFIIFLPYMGGDLYKAALESLRPWWGQLCVIDQSPAHSFPKGPYSLLRARKKLTFTQLQNWMMLLCRKKNVNFMGFAHDDIEFVGRPVDKLLEVAKSTDCGVVLSEYDSLSVWDLYTLEKVGYYDETFPFYYGDLDLFQRIHLHNIHYCSILNHGVTHHFNSALKISSEEDKERILGETDRAREEYIKKWGGNDKQERWRYPYDRV